VTDTVGVSAVRYERTAGVELLGPVHGSGYRDGMALVRRADGQMVQMGPLMYAALECMDGERDPEEVAEAMTALLGRSVGVNQVARLGEKLEREGLLAGSEHLAPPRRNPLLALRFKVLVSGERATSLLTAPFTFLFRPWIMWPAVAGFFVVFWFVLIDRGVAGATEQAFAHPGLLLLVFALTIVSAGFHELGHAAACRYGGARPAGMGMGLYLVWPAFYTDVTDAYRLPRRARLRVDLAGLYFNALIADVTMLVWLAWRVDALLLLVALQVLQMVKQLSPVIRADGYHILADATGVPDLFAHVGPTLRRLIPGHHRETAALRGWSAALVTLWVLVVVPVLISLMVGAVLLLPHLITSAWDSGQHLATGIPHEVSNLQVVNFGAALLQLVALVIPVAGSAFVTVKVVRMAVAKARSWSSGSMVRQALAALVGLAVVAGLVWAWWPSGQYQPVKAQEQGTIGSLLDISSSHPAAPVLVSGAHLAVEMVPQSGPSAAHPAYIFVPAGPGHPPIAIVDTGTSATTFPFALPGAPGPGGNQALALNTTNGGVVYNVAYSLVTVTGGAPVDQSNSAYAIASCKGCTTVAVAVQVVLVVGQSNIAVPADAAGALNYKCPACTTTAIADQIVVTLSQQPSAQLLSELQGALERLNDLTALGANGTPQAVAAVVASVQTQIDAELQSAGITTPPSSTQTPSSTTSTTTQTSSTTDSSQSTSVTTVDQGSATTVPSTSTTVESTSPSTTESTSTTTTSPTTP
jgi:putative peptide zinc metalloprotease protein